MAANTHPSIEVILDLGKETKGTFRFEEREREDGLRVLRSQYVEKWAVKQLGNGGRTPQTIKVTLEAI